MRPTREVIVIVLTIAASTVLVVGMVGLLTLELVRPETDTADALSKIWGVAAAILAGVAGYLTGRWANGGNGHGSR